MAFGDIKHQWSEIMYIGGLVPRWLRKISLPGTWTCTALATELAADFSADFFGRASDRIFGGYFGETLGWKFGRTLAEAGTYLEIDILTQLWTWFKTEVIVRESAAQHVTKPVGVRQKLLHRFYQNQRLNFPRNLTQHLLQNVLQYLQQYLMQNLLRNVPQNVLQSLLQNLLNYLLQNVLKNLLQSLL